MVLSEQYIKAHKIKDLYSDENSRYGYTSFYNRYGWTDYVIDKSLIYSHRTNKYTKKTFTEGLHTHEYYELILYINGNVEYVTDNYIIKPQPYSVIWFRPGQMHTATLISPSVYERYVLYFEKDFFELNNTVIPMLNFMDNQNSNAFNPGAFCVEEIKRITEKTEDALASGWEYGGLLTRALIIELFSIFNKTNTEIAGHYESTDSLIQIKNYIDKEYATLSTVGDIAKKFHYSREHISRKFKDAFNISVSDYIAKRRVLESLPLLNEMLSSRAAYEVGFKSQSAYIHAFVKNMGCLPSDYKKHRYGK